MPQLDWISSTIAVTALAVSATTLWLTHLRAGKVLMTRPSQFYLGGDGDKESSPKVYLRALLYSNAQRGCVVEDLFVSIKRGETTQTFPIWVFGNKGALRRSGGLYVGKEGVNEGHHFLLPNKKTHYKFELGSYQLKVMARTIGSKSSTELFVYSFAIDEQQAKSLSKGGGLYFDWGPESQSYLAHLDEVDQGSGVQIYVEHAGKKIPLEMS